jgi:hypothetical protein
MIFNNYTLLLSCLFLVSIVLQYLRYRQIATKKITISGLLLIKIVFRILIFILLLVTSKSLLNQNDKGNLNAKRALFIIKTKNPSNFNLTEDDQINMITRIPTNKYNSIEICLYNPSNGQFYQFIPPTSEKTFLHVITIERPINHILQKSFKYANQALHPINRIEVYEYSNNEWVLNKNNQDNFNVLGFLSEESSSLSPILRQYLLILILSLLCLDVGIKYRILKI